MYSCRKTDVNQNTPASSQPIDVTAKFFSIPSATHPVVRQIAKELERRNTKNEFINDFARTKGLVIWDKALLNLPGKSAGNSFGGGANGLDSLVYLPLVLQNGNTTNGFLRAIIDDSISFSYCLAKDYKKYPITSANGETSADEFSSFFMLMDNLVFGHTLFTLTSKDLLNGGGPASNHVRKAEILSVADGLTSGNNLCEGTIYTVSWLVQDAANCTCANGAANGGVCQDWQTGCQACSNTVSITITVGDGGCGGGGASQGPVGGGAPITGGPSGGGSGGGQPPPYYPCSSSTPTPNLWPEPLPPCPPPGGGSGWLPIPTSMQYTGYNNFYSSTMAAGRDYQRINNFKNQNLDTSLLDQCMRAILSAIINDTASDLGKLLLKMDYSAFQIPSIEKFKLKFESIDSLVGPNGHIAAILRPASVNYTGGVFTGTIQVSRIFPTMSTDIFMASTLIHEIVHAYLGFLYLRITNGATVASLQSETKGSVFNQYVDSLVSSNHDLLLMDSTLSPSTNFQHNYMANFLLDWVAKVTARYASHFTYPSLAGTGLTSIPQWYFWNLAWGGLEGTNAWQTHWTNYPNLPVTGISTTLTTSSITGFTYPLTSQRVEDVARANANEAIGNSYSIGRKPIGGGCY